MFARGLLAAVFAAFVVAGLHSGETTRQTPSEAPASMYVDTRSGCEHLVYGCTIGKKTSRSSSGPVRITTFNEGP